MLIDHKDTASDQIAEPDWKETCFLQRNHVCFEPVLYARSKNRRLKRHYTRFL